MTRLTKGLLGATALVTLPSLAQAAVVVQAVNIAVPATTAGVYINVLSGATATSPTVAGWDLNLWGSSGLRFWANPPLAAYSGIVANSNNVLDLATGFVIDATSTFSSTSATPTTSPFYTGGNHIFGFRFLNEGTGAYNFGYGRITTTTSTIGRPATLTELVYENTGAALTVAGTATGAVPEPATWTMMILGFGAVGMALRRRKTMQLA